MESKKIKKEKPLNKFWRKLGSGVLLFGAGLTTGSRLELYLQQEGITATQCEGMEIDEQTFKVIEDMLKGKKK